MMTQVRANYSIRPPLLGHYFPVGAAGAAAATVRRHHAGGEPCKFVDLPGRIFNIVWEAVWAVRSPIQC